MGFRQGLTLVLVAASAVGLSLSAEFAGRWPFVQPPLAAAATFIATLLWLRHAPVGHRLAVPLVTALWFAVVM